MGFILFSSQKFFLTAITVASSQTPRFVASNLVIHICPSTLKRAPLGIAEMLEILIVFNGKNEMIELQYFSSIVSVISSFHIFDQ